MIDIDILLFGEAIVTTPELEIPHPRMADRRFVLEPLAELAPDLRHPATRRTVREMLGDGDGAGRPPRLAMKGGRSRGIWYMKRFSTDSRRAARTFRSRVDGRTAKTSRIDQQQEQTAARVIAVAPAGAVRPSGRQRQRQKKQKDQQ